jgi:NAD(P)-dependent dehydrogenase (short-subunit alcohol dehydrogenase family)
MKGLPRKIAVVSGAASGLGESICRRLREEGCRVAGIDLAAPRAELRAEFGDAVTFYAADLADDTRLAEIARRIRAEIGAPSILVNNAALFVFRGADASVEELDRICQVNIRGTSRLTHHILPFLRENGGGSIINLSSVSGFVGQSSFATYNATKFAIRGLTKCWAVDLAPEKIRVNALCPGYIESPAFARWVAEFKLDYDTENKKAGALCIMNRQGKPEEVAAAAAFLASDDASFITGSDLLVDGGFLAR